MFDGQLYPQKHGEDVAEKVVEKPFYPARMGKWKGTAYPMSVLGEEFEHIGKETPLATYGRLLHHNMFATTYERHIP
jgi:hypothetical protein